MSKLNKNELLEGVRHIFLEGFNRDAKPTDGTLRFGIRRYVNNLIEEGHKNPELMNYLLKYDNALSNGAKDFMLFEQFGNGLARYARGNKSVKDIIKLMNETLSEDGAALVGYQLINRIDDPYLQDDVKNAFDIYLEDKCEETRNAFIDALEPLLLASDPIGMKLNLLITDDSSMSANFIHTDYVDESQSNELKKRLQELRDNKMMDQLFDKVQRYIDEKLEEDEKSRLTEKDEYCLNAIANNLGLNLADHISDIRHSDANSNGRLMEVLNQYSNAINAGAYEERLYETFLQNISKFNYLLPVSKAMKAITEKVDSKREEITLTKILEEMKDDHVAFIYIDLIQEDVARYVKEPNATNRIQLRNALMPYASDPYINEMFNIIYADNTKRSNELAEKALNIKDQINIIRENAAVSNIYTPVQYVRENECIFNVNGQFYVKKGNNIAVLDEKYIDQLDDRFVELCQLVNDPHVEINEDYIVLRDNNKYATIYEGYVDIHGHKESRESLRNLREMCMKYDDYDTNFYIMCSCLLENFNNIAKIDWAKHVTLNENHNISADLFKIDSNIFIATHNDAIGQHTFYRNVNPIFCKNKLNEHMGINVSSLFSDLLPSQDKIILKLNETKNSYEESIEKYEDMIDKLNDALKDASDENKEKLEDAVKDATEKLNDIKDEYKEWQKQTDEVTGKSDDSDNNSDKSDDEETDDNTVKEKPNEPIDADEVDNVKAELSQPLGDDTENTDDYDEEETDETSDAISDDEFADYLGSDNDDSEVSDDDTEFDAEEEINTEDDDVFGDDSEDDSSFDDEEFNDNETFGDDSDDEDAFDNEDDEDTEPEEFKVVGFDNDNDSDDDAFEPLPSNNNVTPENDETISDEDEEDNDATDIFGGNTEDPLEIGDEPQEVPDNAPMTQKEQEENAYLPKFSYKIADVMFDENVKENKKEKSGSVIVIVPMIDGTGKKYVENKTIEFYIDDTNTPILDNEPMTNELYAAVIDSIKNHPDYATVCETAEEANEQVGPTIAALKVDDDEDEDWEAEYLRDGNDEDRQTYVVGNDEDSDEDDNWNTITIGDNDSDETEDDNDKLFGFSTSDFDDDGDEDEEDDEEDVIIPTYKSGNTEIELPAPSADGTEIPESVKAKTTKKNLKESIKITPVFKNKNGKNFF